MWDLIGFGVVGGLGLLAAAPFARDRLRPLPDANRAKGDFADLPSGRTHYRLIGPKNGPVFVCVHGLSTPCAAYDALAQRIADAGGRVLSYDLFGRGQSARVRGLQNAEFHQRQLNDLLAHLGLGGDIVLLGYSMGGMIVTQFAARHDRVRGVVLLTAAGTIDIGGKALGMMQGNRFVGQWLYHVSGVKSLETGIDAARGEKVDVAGIHDIQMAELSMRGYRAAVASSIQGMLGDALRAEHDSIRSAGIPVLAIWGALDDVIPLSAKDALAALNPDADQVVVEDAGHGLPYTHADRTASEVLARWPV